jgi:hypothetical protein
VSALANIAACHVSCREWGLCIAAASQALKLEPRNTKVGRASESERQSEKEREGGRGGGGGERERACDPQHYGNVCERVCACVHVCACMRAGFGI